VIKVLWTEQAQVDLVNIRDYIARDSSGYAEVVVDRIFEGVDRLAEFPLSGRLVPEVQDERMREVILGSYRIVYRVRADVVEVLTVFHSSRPFGAWGFPGA
jgi:toxin ParE1/3/4